MIQANQLRLGNWIEYDNRFFQIDTIAEVFPTLNTGEFGIGVVDWNNIKPIELTEERLLQCGFIIRTQDDDAFAEYHHNGIFFKSTVFDVTEKCSVLVIIGLGKIEVHYLHQLQNLYFALTGKELEINL